MTAVGYASTTGDTRKVTKTGDTMTGDLVLNDSSPDTSLSATSKGYTDAAAAAAQAAATAAAETDAATKYLALDGGGTVTGDVTIANGNLIVDSSGTAINAVDRGADSNYAAYALRTAGVDRWAWQMQPGSQDLYLADSANGAPVLRVTPGATPLVTFLGDVAFDGAGGGGGATIRTASERITNDDLSGLPAAGSWTVVQTSAGTQLKCSIDAVAGDRIEVYGNFMYIGSHFLDWVLLDAGGAIALYATSESSSAPGEGNPTMYTSRSFGTLNTADMFTVASGHINAGQVTVALAHQGAGTGGGNLVYAHPTYPFRLRLKNVGAEPS